MISWIKRLFKKNDCVFCKKEAHQPRKYLDDGGKEVTVCPLCVEYAERRAYRKQ
jgi:hypothetical protein